MALNAEHEQYAGKYGHQLSLYKSLLEKATGLPVIATILHYVLQGKMVEIEIKVKKGLQVESI